MTWEVMDAMRCGGDSGASRNQGGDGSNRAATHDGPSHGKTS